MLQIYAHVFHDEDTNDFKSTDVIEHKIIVNDPTKIRRPQDRIPFALRGEYSSERGNSKEEFSLVSSCNNRPQKKFGWETEV